jgi:hypothetical protein
MKKLLCRLLHPSTELITNKVAFPSTTISLRIFLILIFGLLQPLLANYGEENDKRAKEQAQRATLKSFSSFMLINYAASEDFPP